MPILTVWHNAFSGEVRLAQLSEDPFDGVAADQIAHLASLDVNAGFTCVSEDYTGPVPATNSRWQWVNGELTSVPEIPLSITFAQLLIGLVAEGWVTEAEGEAWLIGTLPVPVLTLISSLAPEQQFAAKARAIRPSEILRYDPLVEALAAMQGKTPEELDTFFATYSQV
jgi:hypothetical protein